MQKSKKLSESDRSILKVLLKDECKYCLDEEIMDQFLDCGTVLTLAKGETLIRAGQMDSNIYIVIEGIVAKWRWNNDKEVVDTFSLPGTLFCEYHSYYGNKNSTKFFEACTPLRVLKITAVDYDNLIATSHAFAKWCLSMAQCQLYTYTIRDQILSGSVKERYDNLMKLRPGIVREVSQKTIAAYLGVAPQYLSSLRKEWLRNND